MLNKKLTKIVQKESATLRKIGRELAMNFDIPSRDIILMGCAELGITEKEWRTIQSALCSAQVSA